MFARLFSTRKRITNCLKNRKACVTFGKNKSVSFQIKIGLPQGSAFSPLIFIIYHSDILSCAGAFSTHIFADDLCVLIVPPINKDLSKMMEFLKRKGSQICHNLLEYSNSWKQPVNVTKTVVQLVHNQVVRPAIQIHMGEKLLENVRAFKYLGFHWTDKVSLAPTINYCLEKFRNLVSSLSG
jgi:hypothetical protein